MAVSCHDQLAAFWNACHNRGNYAAGCSVYQHICPLYPVELCILFLCGFEDSFGLEQIICPDNLRDVAVHHLFQKFGVAELLVDCRTLMSRHVEGDGVLIRVVG